MTVNKMDSNGDFVWKGNGNDVLSNNAAAVAQNIQTALALFQGEWFLDTSQGMPWRTQVLGKYTAGVYDTVIKDAILQALGVQSISNYSSSYNSATRSLTVNVTAQSIYGPVTVQTTL